MHIGVTSSINTLLDPTPPPLARALKKRGFESLWYVEHKEIACSLRTRYPGGGKVSEPYKQMINPPSPRLQPWQSVARRPSAIRRTSIDHHVRVA